MSQRALFLFGIPVLVSLLAIISEYTGFDLWLASHFYDAVSQNWPYKSLYLTSTVLHVGAKNVMVAIALLNLAAIPVSYFIPRFKPYSKHLLYIFIAAVTGTLVVGELKSLTHIYTPWELSLFDGNKPYIRLFDHVPPGAEVGYAFPGGHSSGGFAYLSLYFALLIQQHRYRHYALLFPLVVGITFAVTQEVRGAHFLSHDMFSFVICWISALLWSFVFYGRQVLKSDPLPPANP
jgi:membrane-associated PAP2 superfamily phosphatase